MSLTTDEGSDPAYPAPVRLFLKYHPLTEDEGLAVYKYTLSGDRSELVDFINRPVSLISPAMQRFLKDEYMGKIDLKEIKKSYAECKNFYKFYEVRALIEGDPPLTIEAAADKVADTLGLDETKGGNAVARAYGRYKEKQKLLIVKDK